MGLRPSLVTSWKVSADGLLYEFALRKGVKFQNGEPLTAQDVEFSFERYLEPQRTSAGAKEG